MLKRYATELDRIERQYRVQKRFIVALWGIESTYGRHAGKRPVIPALATLAYDERRGHYFRNELLEALKIFDAGEVSLADMTGSWAGAMGPFQFMPTSYRHYAVDGDGDGRIDIWGRSPMRSPRRPITLKSALEGRSNLGAVRQTPRKV